MATQASPAPSSPSTWRNGAYWSSSAARSSRALGSCDSADQTRAGQASSSAMFSQRSRYTRASRAPMPSVPPASASAEIRKRPTASMNRVNR
jgi:hypothetical protein